MFDQVPLVEMDGLKLVQTKAILNYIAEKYNLLGKGLKERVQIDMYVKGTMDLMSLILIYPFTPPEQKEKQLAAFIEKTETKFLVGNQLCLADIQLLEIILMLEEKKADIFAPFPQLQAFKARISSFPTIKKILEPGNQRKPISDDAYVAVVLKVFQLKLS
uniref:glutathione transferase n=1 Tax=Laticauda laticaudata TaxID=8630 RepID=A0A8C5SWM8_LATLA